MHTSDFFFYLMRFTVQDFIVPSDQLKSTLMEIDLQR